MITNCSIVEGEPLHISIKKFDFSSYRIFNIGISKVEAEDTLIKQISSEIESDGFGNIIIPAIKSLETGFYCISYFLLENLASNIPSEDQRIPLKLKIPFEIRKSDEEPHSQIELNARLNEIERERDKIFLRGFGSPKGKENVNEYQGFVFVKDCLVTSRMRFGQYEIFGIGELPFTDEKQIIDSFINKSFSPPFRINYSDIKGEPVFVARFPKVFAESPEKASELILNEVNILINLLSLHRQSYGSGIGILVIDAKMNRVYARLHTPNYRGNLVGGLISGEFPPEIRKRLNKVRNNPRLQLYLSLYTDVLRTENNDFAYFRFWNILETIARSKNYIGKPMNDLNGNVVLNKHQEPRIISNNASELVKELIRSTYKIGESKSGMIEQILKNESVDIWYRRRNCTAHYGGCFSDNPKYCIRDSNNPVYSKCKELRDQYNEMIKNHGFIHDITLENLKSTVEYIIRAELDSIES